MGVYFMCIHMTFGTLNQSRVIHLLFLFFNTHAGTEYNRIFLRSGTTLLLYQANRVLRFCMSHL